MRPVPQTFTYVPRSAEDLRRGLYVTTVGHVLTPAGASYPPHSHPSGFQFNWRDGRVIPSYALVYLRRGQGRFETESMGAIRRVRAGDLMVVFPEEWHRYCPEPAIGWDEVWAGFDGELAPRLLETYGFKRERPLLRLRVRPEFERAFAELIRVASREFPGSRGLAAATVHRIIALTAVFQHIPPDLDGEADCGGGLVQRARENMVRQIGQPLDMHQLARELGIGYSTFRHRFKEGTGLSPKAYQIALRVEEARKLLVTTPLSLNEIAERLGYDTPFYFMRQFKEKTGMTAGDWRRKRARRSG